MRRGRRAGRYETISFVKLYNTLAYGMMDSIEACHFSAGTEDCALVRLGLSHFPEDAG